MKTIPSFYFKTRGATLVVALIILSVMTVLGVATMQNSTLQERMASNSRQKLVADAAAESALREAENWLLSNITDEAKISSIFFTARNSGFYADRDLPYLVSISHTSVSNNIDDIADDTVWLKDETKSMSVKFLKNTWTDGDWSRTPRVVIEVLGQDRIGDRTVAGSNSQNIDDGIEMYRENPWVFRITAIGWSKNPDIYSVLQSTFITGKQFGG